MKLIRILLITVIAVAGLELGEADAAGTNLAVVPLQIKLPPPPPHPRGPVLRRPPRRRPALRHPRKLKLPHINLHLPPPPPHP